MSPLGCIELCAIISMIKEEKLFNKKSRSIVASAAPHQAAPYCAASQLGRNGGGVLFIFFSISRCWQDGERKAHLKLFSVLRIEILLRLNYYSAAAQVSPSAIMLRGKKGLASRGWTSRPATHPSTLLSFFRLSKEVFLCTLATRSRHSAAAAWFLVGSAAENEGNRKYLYLPTPCAL